MTTSPRIGQTDHGNDIEAAIHEYLKKSNRLIPTTPEEVEAMERWIAEQDVRVPEELLGRQGCTLTPRQRQARVLRYPVHSSDVEQGLARAAREGGKPVSTEVEERMKRDREQKERESKGDK